MSVFDRHGMDTRSKYPTPTVEVIAVTKPPTPGFRYAGRFVGFGEEVRIPRDFARDLVRRGKAKIVSGTEETVLM